MARTYFTQMEKAAPDMKAALEQCVQELARQDRKHTVAYKMACLALSRADGVLTNMEDEEIYGVPA